MNRLTPVDVTCAKFEDAVKARIQAEEILYNQIDFAEAARVRFAGG